MDNKNQNKKYQWQEETIQSLKEKEAYKIILNAQAGDGKTHLSAKALLEVFDKNKNNQTNIYLSATNNECKEIYNRIQKQQRKELDKYKNIKIFKINSVNHYNKKEVENYIDFLIENFSFTDEEKHNLEIKLNKFKTQQLRRENDELNNETTNIWKILYSLIQEKKYLLEKKNIKYLNDNSVELITFLTEEERIEIYGEYNYIYILTYHKFLLPAMNSNMLAKSIPNKNLIIMDEIQKFYEIYNEIGIDKKLEQNNSKLVFEQIIHIKKIYTQLINSDDDLMLNIEELAKKTITFIINKNGNIKKELKSLALKYKNKLIEVINQNYIENKIINKNKTNILKNYPYSIFLAGENKIKDRRIFFISGKYNSDKEKETEKKENKNFFVQEENNNWFYREWENNDLKEKLNFSEEEFKKIYKLSLQLPKIIIDNFKSIIEEEMEEAGITITDVMRAELEYKIINNFEILKYFIILNGIKNIYKKSEKRFSYMYFENRKDISNEYEINNIKEINLIKDFENEKYLKEIFGEKIIQLSATIYKDIFGNKPYFKNSLNILNEKIEGYENIYTQYQKAQLIHIKEKQNWIKKSKIIKLKEDEINYHNQLKKRNLNTAFIYLNSKEKISNEIKKLKVNKYKELKESEIEFFLKKEKPENIAFYIEKSNTLEDNKLNELLSKLYKSKKAEKVITLIFLSKDKSEAMNIFYKKYKNEKEEIIEQDIDAIFDLQKKTYKFNQKYLFANNISLFNRNKLSEEEIADKTKEIEESTRGLVYIENNQKVFNEIGFHNKNSKELLKVIEKIRKIKKINKNNEEKEINKDYNKNILIQRMTRMTRNKNNLERPKLLFLSKETINDYIAVIENLEEEKNTNKWNNELFKYFNKSIKENIEEIFIENLYKELIYKIKTIKQINLQPKQRGVLARKIVGIFKGTIEEDKFVNNMFSRINNDEMFFDTLERIIIDIIKNKLTKINNKNELLTFIKIDLINKLHTEPIIELNPKYSENLLKKEKTTKLSDKEKLQIMYIKTGKENIKNQKTIDNHVKGYDFEREVEKILKKINPNIKNNTEYIKEILINIKNNIDIFNYVYELGDFYEIKNEQLIIYDAKITGDYYKTENFNKRNEVKIKKIKDIIELNILNIKEIKFQYITNIERNEVIPSKQETINIKNKEIKIIFEETNIESLK
jgi:hypothetical protein